MDLLKGITQGLRGDDQSAQRDGRSRSTANRQSDRRSAASSSDGAGGTDSASRTESDDAASPDGGRAEEHVCSFCGAAFDASRGACPECDAEIVFRGQR